MWTVRPHKCDAKVRRARTMMVQVGIDLAASCTIPLGGYDARMALSPLQSATQNVMQREGLRRDGDSRAVAFSREREVTVE